MSNTGLCFIFMVVFAISPSTSPPVLYKEVPKNVIRYLQNYGYLTPDLEPERLSVKKALRKFQERYHLDPSGKINEATIAAINIPRCAQFDADKLVKLPTVRKFTVKIDFDSMKLFRFRARFITLLHKALELWNKAGNISFYEAIGTSPADIHVIFSNSKNHSQLFVPTEVMYATNPTNHHHSQIIINEKAQFLNLKFNRSIPKNGSDLLRVLAHGIGHNLGFAHSSQDDSIMSPLFPIVDSKQQLALNAKDIFLLRDTYDHLWTTSKQHNNNTCSEQQPRLLKSCGNKSSFRPVDFILTLIMLRAFA